MMETNTIHSTGTMVSDKKIISGLCFLIFALKDLIALGRGERPCNSKPFCLHIFFGGSFELASSPCLVGIRRKGYSQVAPWVFWTSPLNQIANPTAKLLNLSHLIEGIRLHLAHPIAQAFEFLGRRAQYMIARLLVDTLGHPRINFLWPPEDKITIRYFTKKQ